VEMPAIEALHRAYSDKGLRVVAISVDDPGTEPQIRSFVARYGLTFEVLHDPAGQEGKISRNYQVTGYPQTVIIGRDGIIRRKLLGAHNWNSAENRGLIERLLAVRAAE
jgi:cytochrome c biogenesis protein CcmG/thiol:disulfide interchange protein DsbE